MPPSPAIADELGLTKASVYNYFPAKGDLRGALAEPCLTGLEASPGTLALTG